MVPVVVSILLVVLMSGAVLWVVAGEAVQPTGTTASLVDVVEEPSPVEPALPADASAGPLPPRQESLGPEPDPPPGRPRRPATSRRRPPPSAPPTEVPPAAVPAVPAARSTAPARPAGATVRMAGAPMPAHRIRSGFFLVVLVLFIGVAVAVVIGALVAAVAFLLRSAVTS